MLKNQENVVLKTTPVALRISFLSDTSNNPVYQELHQAVTTNIGLVNLRIGNGEALYGSFNDLNWSAQTYFMQIELKTSEQSEFLHLGYTVLHSVPYAMHAKSAENVNDADADPENELQVISILGDTIFLENGGFIVLPPDNVNDADADPTNEYQTINFENDSLEITFGNKIKIPITDTTWRFQGEDLYFNSGKVGIGTNTPSTKLIVKGDETTAFDDLLFAVVNNAGDTVFAVFQGGVRIYVEDNQKKAVGNKAGFAVGGFNSSKGITNEYLRVTPDSVRVYIEDESEDKPKMNRGGFAIGGFNSYKTGIKDLMYLTPDNYFIGHESGVHNTSGKYNSFFGYEAGMFNEIGNQNILIGYKAGRMGVWANRNIFIGNKAGYTNDSGEQNVFIGHHAGYSNVHGWKNIFIGDSAGYYSEKSISNIYLGEKTGIENQGTQNIILGNRAGSASDSINNCIIIGEFAGTNAQGDSNIIVGTFSGSGNEGVSNIILGTDAGSGTGNGSRNVYIGKSTGQSNMSGNENVFLGYEAGSHPHLSGSNNVFIGSYAGYHETNANKLYIENSSAQADTAFIYGEFDKDSLCLNAKVRISKSLIVKESVKVEEVIRLSPLSEAPANPEKGTLYFDETTNKLKVWDGSVWQGCY